MNNMKHNEIKMNAKAYGNNYLLDTGVRHQYDKGENCHSGHSFHCHSGPRAGIQRDDKLMPTVFRMENGRSMVEMLGTLAIIGVLSIGGIAGYSYGMDKYRANEIINDVNLRGIDLVAQVSTGRTDLSLSEWPTKTAGKYDIGLEVDTTTNTTDSGIYVLNVPNRVCEIIGKDLLPEDVELVIDGEKYISGTCGEINKMVFYYDTGAETLEGENQNCVETEKGCRSCPVGATISADKTTCECLNGQNWDADTNECAGNTCEMAMDESGISAENVSINGNTIIITGNDYVELPALSVENCNLVFDVDAGNVIGALGEIKAKTLTVNNNIAFIAKTPEALLSTKQITIQDGCEIDSMLVDTRNINSNGKIELFDCTFQPNVSINGDEVYSTSHIYDATITAKDIILEDIEIQGMTANASNKFEMTNCDLSQVSAEDRVNIIAKHITVSGNTYGDADYIRMKSETVDTDSDIFYPGMWEQL